MVARRTSIYADYRPASKDILDFGLLPAVEEWTAVIKQEEALASVNHSVAEVDKWEGAHFAEDKIPNKVKAAKKQYEDALREKFLDSEDEWSRPLIRVRHAVHARPRGTQRPRTTLEDHTTLPVTLGRPALDTSRDSAVLRPLQRGRFTLGYGLDEGCSKQVKWETVDGSVQRAHFAISKPLL